MKDPVLYLLHIRDAAERILEYSVATEAHWMENKMATDAICRNLIGAGLLFSNCSRAWSAPLAGTSSAE